MSTLDMSLQARFNRWIAENPHVYDEVVKMARRWRTVRGAKARVGVATLWEALRWSSGLSTSGDPWVLNNSFRAGLARLVMRQEPDLSGIFEIRERSKP